MADHNGPLAKSARRKKDEGIFCVGWRAFVNCPVPGARNAGSVPMSDAEGNAVTNDLADGQVVEILSWRPRSRDGLLYQIRRLTDGSEWWIGAQYLRRQAIAPALPDAEPRVARR